MKKTKSLVITSLLFSTMILNPSMINAVVVNAAAGASSEQTTDTAKPTTPEKKTYIVKFIDGAKKVGTTTVNLGSDVKLSTDHFTAPTGYEIVANQKFEADDDNNVNVKVMKTINKDITINFTDNAGTAIDGINDQTKSIAVDATDLKGYYNLAPYGYRVSDNQDLKVVDGKVTIKLTKTKRISVNFKYHNTDLAVSQDLTHDTIDDDATTIDKNKLHLPKGYILENDTNDFKVVNNSVTLNVTHVNMKKVSIIYMDGIKKLQIVNPFVTKELSVPVDSTNISASDIQIPTGYSLHDVNAFQIINGIVTVKLDAGTGNSSTTTKPGTQTKPTTPSTKPGNGSSSSNSDNITYTNTVQFIDKNTGKEIGSVNISGLNGSTHTIAIPNGYELANNESATVKVDKSQKAFHISLINKNNTTAEGTVTSHKATFRTSKVTQLFNKDGKAVQNRALMANTSWAVDKLMILGGTSYYRVATNEWAKVADGTEETITQSTSIKQTITTSGNSAKHIYTSTGQLVGNRALAPNTP